jgi:hypothetical protein
MAMGEKETSNCRYCSANPASLKTKESEAPFRAGFPIPDPNPEPFHENRPTQGAANCKM